MFTVEASSKSSYFNSFESVQESSDDEDQLLQLQQVHDLCNSGTEVTKDTFTLINVILFQQWIKFQPNNFKIYIK